MDAMHAVDDTMQERLDLVEKKRFDSFRLGKPQMASSRPRSFHGRSRSRNTSISSLSTISVPNSLDLMNDMSPTSTAPANRPTSRPNSHHRRQSSVSTRRESAEVMGVSLSDLQPSVSNDNINLGDKDSVRRQALWALEGKSTVGQYSKVEIPELGTPEIEKRIFEFPTKPSFPPGPAGIGGIMGKRDSLGKLILPSSSSKDQLGTLLEEEEEDEAEEFTPEIEEASPVVISVTTPSPTPARQRPTGLSLRPLSLTPETVVSFTSGNLPTPVQTPRSIGLKSLTLTSSPSPVLGDEKENQNAEPTSASRRMSLNMDSERRRSTSPAEILQRRSSISYICSSDSPRGSAGCLPTPEMTPTSTTSGRYRYSTSSTDSDLARDPLSSTEQHFLVKQHSALLARIEDLERALSARPRSWHMSYASDISSSASVGTPSEPSDEILRLVADLKAERDELKKDVDGWRVRVHDLQKQVGTLANRVDMERREAWVARERVGLLTIEKSSLEKELAAQSALVEETQGRYTTVKEAFDALQEKYEHLEQELERSLKYQEECTALRAELVQERSRREAIERELENAGLVATPTPNAFEFKLSSSRNRSVGFMSVDSESSFTDVESLDGTSFRSGKTLKAVVEEEEERYFDDELVRYEDENESDVSFESPGGSSVGSFEDLRRSVRDLSVDIPVAPMISGDVLSSSPSPLQSPAPSPIFDEPPKPAHGRHHSLSKTWTFPKGPQTQVSRRKESVDRFFECLEDLDNSPPLPAPGAKSDKSVFSYGFAAVKDDDLPPFLLPTDVGTVVPEETGPTRSLEALIEEDEEEEEEDREDALSDIVGEEVEGGIRFTFTPPSLHSTPTACFNESVEDVAEDVEVPLIFPQQRAVEESFSQEESVSFQLPSPVKTRSPSCIPRSTSSKRFTSSIPVPVKSTPPKAAVPESPVSPTGNLCFFTPPSKRGGAMPAYQRSPSTPSPVRTNTPARPRAVSAATFIPQPPARQGPIKNKSDMSNGSIGLPYLKSSVIGGVGNVPSRSYDKPLNASASHSHMSGPSKTLTFDTSSTHDDLQFSANVTPSPVTSSLFSPRLSLLTNFITVRGLPWSPRRNSDSPVFPNNPDDMNVTTPERKERVFVSKEKQLEALRARMEEERKMRMRPRGVINL
ncbi:hypothetical protein NEOLEDRAFT_1168426 [Neolentinus lepideus HHB14362 ss-1]|uniref:Uncharacterized protein n=1 Tax=Neolentinus lepideus HHB14362 ss-1 TaxID=1314782 RepID=A0A165TMX2_9AGAM|nr:hypothetical protein NEOLEDRAFT_1168426 [Neolentinus lepideus HHB14362 ss-1]